jgi:hypothetical protein
MSSNQLSPVASRVNSNTGETMKRNILTGALMLALCSVFSGAVKADNIHLCDVSTGCSATSVIPISGSSTTAFLSGNPTGDSLFLAILNPVSDNSGNWHSGTLWSALGVVGGSTFPNLSSAISQDFGATGVTAASFNVSDVNIGTWTMNPQTVTLPTGEPAGTLILAFTELPNGNLGLVTPWSSSLGTTGGTTPTPEPSSVILLGVGLIGLVALKRVIV